MLLYQIQWSGSCSGGEQGAASPASRLGDRSNSSVKMFGKQCECSGACGKSACSECGRSVACALAWHGDMGRWPEGDAARPATMGSCQQFAVWSYYVAGVGTRRYKHPFYRVSWRSSLLCRCRAALAVHDAARWWRGGACIILPRAAADNSVRELRVQCGGSECVALTRAALQVASAAARCPSSASSCWSPWA